MTVDQAYVGMLVTYRVPLGDSALAGQTLTGVVMSTNAEAVGVYWETGKWGILFWSPTGRAQYLVPLPSLVG